MSHAPAFLIAATLLAAATPGASGQHERELPPLPEETSEAARQVWSRLVEAALPSGSGTDHAPVVSFDLYFDGRSRPNDVQTNDFDAARYQFLAPRWIKTTLESGRIRLRGPCGDFMIEKDSAIPLRGRDYEEDRRELDQAERVARAFTVLTDPATLHIRALRVMKLPPAGFPPELAEEAWALEWIEVESPDFGLAQAARGPASRPSTEGAAHRPPERTATVRLGLDRDSNLPVLAVIREELAPGEGAGSDMLVRFDAYRRIDGFRVPGQLQVFGAREGGGGFDGRPALELWLLRGSLRPSLGESDFLPPR